jgi:hypothetical protein
MLDVSCFENLNFSRSGQLFDSTSVGAQAFARGASDDIFTDTLKTSKLSYNQGQREESWSRGAATSTANASIQISGWVPTATSMYRMWYASGISNLNHCCTILLIRSSSTVLSLPNFLCPFLPPVLAFAIAFLNLSLSAVFSALSRCEVSYAARRSSASRF